MTDETATEGAAPAAVNLAAVPAHVIPAVLPHPNISAPLARGVQYLHHFEILLVSDGKRLWDAASDEGKQVLSDIKAENAAHADTIAAAKAAPALAAATDGPVGEPGGEPDPSTKPVTA